jgi:cbb3-type cytochrome c oxidase subunit III
MNAMGSRSLVLASAVVVAALLMFRAERTSLATTAAPDGKAIFGAKCSACHNANGGGSGPYPPLAGNSDITSSNTAGIIATVLNGRSGPITVSGKSYSGTMPAWRGQLSNAEIAAVISYVRGAWTNAAPIVTEAQVALVAKPVAQSGAAIYVAKCSTCHQVNGQGTNDFPPLAGNSDIVAADPKSIVATIVNGRTGTLSVNGKKYVGTMPTWNGQLSNADIAAVATYVRSAWGNNAAGVTEQQVASGGVAVLATVGKSIYGTRCAGCHRADGSGQSPIFPALAGNTDVTASDPSGIIATVSHGRKVMPAWKGQLSAGDIAAVLTYIRSAWGNKAGPVAEQDVAAAK